jgi:hypothetical protein
MQNRPLNRDNYLVKAVRFALRIHHQKIIQVVFHGI